MTEEVIEPYISKRGYSIPKDCLDIEDQIFLRKDLSVVHTFKIHLLNLLVFQYIET